MGLKWGRPRLCLLMGIGVVASASLLFSISFTGSHPSPAYFVTPTRVWEFAVGDLLALAGSHISLPRLFALPLALMGWTAIGFAAVTFNVETVFPGAAAFVPVLGTVAVIAAGTCSRVAPFQGLVGARPVKMLGDISYSIYLWHWPMIVVAPYVINAEPRVQGS